MLKKGLIIGAVLLVGVIALSGCSPKQDEEMQQMKEQVQNLEQELSETMQQLESTQNELRDTEQELEMARGNVGGQEDELSDLQSQLQAKDSEISQIQEQMAQTRSTNKDLQERLTEAEAQRQEMEQQIRSLRSEKNSAVQETRKIQEENQQLRQDVDELRKQVQELQEKLAVRQKEQQEKAVAAAKKNDQQETAKASMGNGQAPQTAAKTETAGNRTQRTAQKSSMQKAMQDRRSYSQTSMDDKGFYPWGADPQERMLAGAVDNPEGLDVTFNTTWVSKYIWRGFDKLDDKAAFQPSLNIDLYDTGFYTSLWMSYAGSSQDGGTISTVNATEYRYTIGFLNKVYEDQRYELDYRLSWTYYDFIDEPDNAQDFQDLALLLSWPEICPFGAVVPHYEVVYMWPTEGGGPSAGLGGWYQAAGLTYEWDAADLLNLEQEQVVALSWEIAYNGGAGLGNNSVDHDWSHVVWGASTDIELGQYGMLTPGVWYQTSMDRSVNNEDEFWAGVSYRYTF